MKIITTKKETLKNGKKKTIKVLGIPVVRKRRTSQKKEMRVCGIKVQNKKVREKAPPVIIPVVTNNANEGYIFDYNDDVIEYLFKIIIKEKEYGARPILRAIQNEIENKLIDILIENDDKNTFNFSISEEKIFVI